MAQDKNAPDSAKKAMADYYDDVLGSLLGGSEACAVGPDKAKDSSSGSSDSGTSAAREGGASGAEPVRQSFEPKPLEAQSKEPKETSSTVFAEPPGPRKLPTLAPPKIKPALVEPKTATVSDTKVETSVRVEPLTDTQSETEVNTDVEDVNVTSLAKPKSISVEDNKLTESAELNSESQVSDATGLLKPADWLENGRPAWAQSRFECLLFSVAGLKLAVPLVSLGSIHRIDKELTPLVGRAEWFIGLYRNGERNINVVDTAKWVMPRQYHAGVIDGYQFVIRLGDSSWGVACDSVAEAIQLEPDQVKWRTERSKRAWLSGTVIEHMCALLDADMLSYLLQDDTRPDGIKKGA